MSVFDKSGSTFYDSTGQSASDSQILDVSPENPTTPVIPPPYDMHGGGGAESFEPINSGVSDSSFQPNQVDVPAGPKIQPWMLLLAGAVVVLLLRETGRR